MTKIIITGPEPHKTGGPSSFVRNLVSCLNGHYAIDYVTRKNTLLSLMRGFSTHKAILLNSNNLVPLPFLILHLLLQSKTKIIFIIHGQMGKELPFGLKKFLLNLCERLALWRADKIVLVSHMFKEDFLNGGRERYSAKCFVAPNGVELNSSRLENKEISSRITFIYAGGRRKEKGIALIEQLLLDSRLLNMPNIRILILGTEHDAKIIRQNTLIEERRWISETEFVKVLSGCDIFLSPSRYETYGIALLQAYLAGCKIVTYKKCGALEQITQKNNIFVFDTYSYESFWNEIKRALNSKIDETPPRGDAFSFQKMRETYTHLIEY